MARAWVQDLWVKDAVVRDERGKIAQRLKPTSRELQAIQKLPKQYRSSNFGKGSRWRVNWIEELDGKPTRKTEIFVTKAPAEQRVTELSSALQGGTHVTKDLKKQLVRDVAKTWLKSKQKIRSSTKKRYQDELNRYVLPKWGDRTLDGITDTEVEEWVAQLRGGTAPHYFEIERKQAKLEASAVKHIVRIVFGAIMRYSVTKGWIPKSPVTGVELPEPTERDVDAQILAPVELQALIEATASISEQDGRAVQTLAFTGLRIGELFALQVRDLVGTTLTVRATLTQSETGIVVGPTKGGKPRNIPLAPVVSEALSKQSEGQPANAFIFRSSQGGHLDVHNWRARVFSKAVAGAGLEIEGLTPHSLRHTAASMAISAGANILIVQRMLGHKNAKITLDTYGHLYPSDLDAIGGLIQTHYEQGLRSD